MSALVVPGSAHQQPPKTATVTRVAHVLLNKLAVDAPIQVSLGVSYRGFHFVRFTGVTRGVNWQVDVYRCRHFVVSCATRRSITRGNLLSVLTYLQAATA